MLWSARARTRSPRSSTSTRAATRRFEWVATRNGAATSRPAQQFAARRTTSYLRVSSNGGGTLHRRGLVRRRDLAADRRPDHRSRRSGGPEGRAEGLRQRRHRQLRGLRLLPRRLLGQGRADDDRVASTPRARRRARLVHDTRRRSTLTADDGAGRRRRRSAYRVDDGPLQTYDGAVHGRGRGEHEVDVLRHRRGRSNVETAKSLAFRVDGDAPVTTAEASIDAANAAGQAVTLAGGRRRRLGRRRHGVPRRRRPVDGLRAEGRADLRRQRVVARTSGAQAGPGRFDLLPTTARAGSPSRRARHALVPGQAVRGLLAQAAVPRRSPTAGHSNGGVFVRFPDPRVPPTSGRTRAPDRLGGERRGLGRDLLRPRDPALRRADRRGRRRPGRSTTSTAERPRQASADRAGRVERLRDPGRRPARTRSSATAR